MSEHSKIDFEIRDVPELDAYLDCALPIIRIFPATPESPGNSGTCFAVTFRDHLLFVTAAHCIANTSLEAIWIPQAFGEKLRRIPLRTVVQPPLSDPEDTDRFDLAVLVPDRDFHLSNGHATPVKIGTVANMGKVRKAKFLFARGYPTNEAIDYDRVHIPRNSLSVGGVYDGPLGGAQGCHTMMFTPELSIHTDGFSGGPVAHAQKSRDGWQIGLAGVAIRGGTNYLHFVDVSFVIELLQDALNQVVDR